MYFEFFEVRQTLNNALFDKSVDLRRRTASLTLAMRGFNSVHADCRLCIYQVHADSLAFFAKMQPGTGNLIEQRVAEFKTMVTAALFPRLHPECGESEPAVLPTGPIKTRGEVYCCNQIKRVLEGSDRQAAHKIIGPEDLQFFDSGSR